MNLIYDIYVNHVKLYIIKYQYVIYIIYKYYNVTHYI